MPMHPHPPPPDRLLTDERLNPTSGLKLLHPQPSKLFWLIRMWPPGDECHYDPCMLEGAFAKDVPQLSLGFRIPEDWL